MNHFVPCPSCDRHVRAASMACPFCDGPLPAAPPASADPPRGISRSALLAFGAAAIATTAVGCGGSTANSGGDSGAGNGQQTNKVQMVATDPNGDQQQQQQQQLQQEQDQHRERRHNNWDGHGVAPPYGSPPFEAA